MAGVEIYERCFTLTWETENFGLLLEENDGILASPVWKVEHNEGNEWYELRVAHSSECLLFHISLLQEVSGKGQSHLSIISSCGEVPLKEIYIKEKLFFLIENDAVFGDKKQSMIPNNALTVRCRMRGGTMKNQELRICSVLYSIKYLWNIQQFNSSCSHKTFFEQKNFLFNVCLNAKREEGTHEVIVEVHYAERCVSFVDCALSTTNGCELIKNKTCFFPCVRWTCDIEKFPENMERIDVQFRSIVSLHKNCQTVQHESASKAVPGPPGALSDFLLLYREGTLSDATLNTESKSFSAHRSILAARSPVFRAMFEKDEMKEGRSGVVDIDDVDSATVDRMLVFLYGEKLDDVQWEEATALYYAADKYDVLSLKQRCIDILKAGLAVENACDALIFADTHSDEHLRKCVVDFIRDHQEVFSSSKWEKLEESNPRLTIKTFREVYVKN